MGGGGFERKFGPCARVSQAMGKVKGHRFLQFQHPRKPKGEVGDKVEVVWERKVLCCPTHKSLKYRVVLGTR